MSDETLKSRLLAAYESDPDRSKMGRLRKQYDTIIDLQKGGMRLEKILAVLNAEKKQEDKLTMKTLNGYLYLLKKEKKGVEKAVMVAPAPGVPPIQPPPPENTPVAPGAQKPRKRGNVSAGTVGVANPVAFTSDDVKNSFAEKKDFSRYDD